jgi:DNA-binding SARP family transcriptional activator
MANSSSGQIKVFLLGEARIETSISEITPTAEVVFATALYLILQRDQAVPRTSLQDLLWPGAPQTIAAHRLRQTLLKLSKLGIEVERLGRGRIRLAPVPVALDVENLINHRAPRQAITESSAIKPFGDYDPSFSTPYRDWLEGRRDRIVGALTRLLLGLITEGRRLGQWSDVERFTLKLRDIAPLNEEAALALAESYAMRGSKIEGIRILDSYLIEIDSAAVDLRLQAAVLRKRIANQPLPLEPTAYETPFVGRASVLAAIGEQLHATKARAGQACLVLGDAGIGKSRLFVELASFAALQGFSVQRIQCRPSYKHRPLSVFIELAGVLRSLRGAIGCSPDTLADLDRLTRHRPIDRAVDLEVSQSQWAYGRILKALFDILDAVSDETPLLIQIEDVHWLDPTSSEVLSDMLEWATTHSVFFALTGRDTPESWRGDDHPRLPIVKLEPLDADSSAELLQSIANRSGRQFTPEYLRWCVSAAEGNPYFLQELATHWIETGTAKSVPHSLSSILASRVNRLSADALQILQVCALLENNSSVQRLEEILGYEPHRLLEGINSLALAGMMTVGAEEIAGIPQSRIGSKHELLSNAALVRLTEPARMYLHRRIGSVLEREVDTHFSTSVLWDCAKHWRLAGDAQRALTLALSCARHLMEVGLAESAISAYERCIPFCMSDRQRLEVLEGEAAASYQASDWQRVRDVAALANTVRDRVFPGETSHTDLELMDLRAQWQSLEWEEIAGKAADCLNATDAPPRHRVEAGIMALMLLGLQGNQDTVTSAYTMICTLIDEHELSNAFRLKAEMVYHTEFGDLNVAIEAAKALVAEHESEGDIGALVRTYSNSAVTFRVGGLFDEAEISLKRALELSERYSLERSMVRVLPMLANVALERGNVADAKHWYDKLSGLSLDRSNELGALEFGAIGARLALIEGDGGTAFRRWGRERSDAQNDRVLHRRKYNCALQLGIDLAGSGIPNQETLECLIQSFRASKRGVHQSFSISILYAALLRVGRSNDAEEVLKDYLVNQRREPWPLPTYLINGALELGANLQGVAQQQTPSSDH